MIGGVRWHDGGILIGIVGLVAAVAFAIHFSLRTGIVTALWSLAAIVARVFFVRFKPRAERGGRG
jgi:hypothetical protein